MTPKPTSCERPEPPWLGAPCRNCGTTLHGRHCSHCGQRADRDPRTLRGVLSDLMDELVGADARLPRTLLLLSWSPGRLAADYLGGRRARYVPPVRLYLGTSVFALVAAKVAVHLPRWLDLARGEVPAPGGGTGGPQTQLDPLSPDTPGWLVLLRALAVDRIAQAQADPLVLVDGLLEALPAVLVAVLPLAAVWTALLNVRSGRYFVEHLLVTVFLEASAFLLVGTTALLVVAGRLAGVAEAAAAGNLFLAGVAIVFFHAMGVFRWVYGAGWRRAFFKAAVLLWGYGVLGVLGFVAAALLGLVMG